MERDRNQQVGMLGHQPHHLPRDRLGKGSSSAIFEAQRDRAGDIAIRDRCAYPGMARPLGMAGGAERLRPAIISEGDVAGRAPGRREETQRSPARSAETMILTGYRAAAGAARGQRKIGDKPQRSEQPRHTPLSRRTSGGTSPRDERS